MKKKELGAKPFLYPMPTVIVGANVDGKPNYLAIAYVGIVGNSQIAIGIAKTHHTTQGIKEHGTFSVNIPSQDMVNMTDYVGIYSGKKVDKSELFTSFYGKLETAPMIEECPLNLECNVLETLDFERAHGVVIGEIVASYAEEKYLSNDKPDIKKIQPFVFATHNYGYWGIGEYLGEPFKIGKTLAK